MKKFLFVYSTSVDYACWIHMSFSDGRTYQEVSLPNGVSDWEVIEEAKSREKTNFVEFYGCAGESRTTSQLIRVAHLARDLSFDPTHPESPTTEQNEDGKASPAIS